MEKKQKILNAVAAALAVILLMVFAWGVKHMTEPEALKVSDGIERVDLDTIRLQNGKVEVDFSEVIASDHRETRKLIVSTRIGTVSTTLTERVIKKLDVNILKKTQNVSYTGTGYFVVDLDKLTRENVIQDKENKTVTIRIGHAYLQAIEIDPEKISIGEVEKGFLTRGDIELTVTDYNEIEKDLRTRLESKFNTASNGQTADDLALKMVKEIYEPIVKAIDRRYSVIVEFK